MEIYVAHRAIVEAAEGVGADLIVDAVPETTYHGVVVEVGSSGFEKRAQPDVTFFKVKILLEDADPALRPGMSVRADIASATHEDVPVVPIQAVVERPPPEGFATGKEEIPVVFTLEDGKAVKKPVETGISDATRVEIVEGLETGEQVIVGPYRELRDLEAGDSVRTGEADEE